MLAYLAKLLSSEQADPEWALTSAFELVTQTGGTLVIRPGQASLQVEQLQALLHDVLEAEPQAFKRIHFDLSNVQKLAGPWGAHFAMLIQLARMLNLPVSVGGLHRQPAAMVWLFKDSPEVRALLKHNSSDQDGSSAEMVLPMAA